MFKKNKPVHPGPNISRTNARGSELVATGRSLPPRGSMSAMQAVLPRHWWQGYTFKKWRRRTILFIVALFLATVIFVGYKFWSNIEQLFGGNFFGLFSSQRLHGEDRGRVNILIAGNSDDDPGHNGANLTDSIMIASIDTKNHTAFLLSIPRDLWVNIPGRGYAKINEAYQDGSNYGKNTAAGMHLLEDVISRDFGLPIDYYALVNYAAIKDAVNAVGGIDVTIKSDNPNGIFDAGTDWSTGGYLIKLSNGTHHLNGHQALNLARARGEAYGSYGLAQGDYARTMYQRQMLIALKNKATSAGTLLNPFRLSSLLDAVGNNVKTDFTTSEIHRLYDITKPIGANNVKSYGLNDIDGKGTSLVMGATNVYGQSIQVPKLGIDNFYQIQQFIKKITAVTSS